MDVESEFREMCRGMAADEVVEVIGRMREAGVAEDITGVARVKTSSACSGRYAIERDARRSASVSSQRPPRPAVMVNRVPRKVYETELVRLQSELNVMQEWVRATGARLAVIFEGRDAAGKGGTIKRITQYMNPRVCRIAALPVPTERERTQWYFQRYVEQLPAGGEVVLFDRSWYNRAGVEKVLGFCTPDEHRLFLRQCPIFERLLVEDGLILVKYWFSVSDEEQERRFQARLTDPLRQWKFSPADLKSRERWVDFSRAKDGMFTYTDVPEVPWYVVDASDKRRARLNCIAHLLSLIPYEDVAHPPVELPPRGDDEDYVRPSRDVYNDVPDHAATL